ncbi:carboxylate-amine ligase [Actinomadura flavalba]|uniref:carboxylate-amine ligase n=1 Tax=Actinomadura flavalba TaxID=1120938 RepID=UPI0003723293|nr:glutamate--cysteine ligase [Actinomadura flavalba]
MTRRFGIEEEYFVVDPVTRQVVPRGGPVVARAHAALGDRASSELLSSLVEAKTPPCDDLAKLTDQVRAMRAAMAGAAAREDVALAATGTPVLGELLPPPLTPGPRYAESLATYRALDEEQCICSCHVHVEVSSPARAVAAANHLRRWLPALLALTANSPYWAGRDTGHACWRALTWARWPVAGPPPHFTSAAHYEELVGALLESGALMDRATVFWDVRPSDHLPTVEVRLADVALTAADAATFAGLVRALVTRGLEDEEAGRPPSRPSGELLRAAYWLAARHGLSGPGLDVATGRTVPAADLVTGLLDHAAPALADAGDLTAVRRGVAAILMRGTGAARQRAAFRRRERLTDVVDLALLRPDGP